MTTPFLSKVSGSLISVRKYLMIICISDLHLDSDCLIEKLNSYCSDYGLNLSRDVFCKCITHLELVIERNNTVNLTRILDVDDALVLHLLDSLLLLPFFEKAPEGKFLDMGTGAGFPGIELGVASQREGLLIDSVNKKIEAVDSFISDLSIPNLKAEHIRIEDAGKKYRKQFSIVTARALASIPVLIEYATPFLSRDGLLILTKGNPSEIEIDSGNKAAEICGLDLIQHKELDLPNELGHRSYFIYQRIKQTSILLPRQNGLAKKKPLA